MIKSCMSISQMVFEADNVTLPALHTALGNNPYLFCYLVNQSEVVTHKYKSSIPL